MLKLYDGQTKLMYFFIKNDYFLEKYITILDKVRTDIKKEFDNNPVYNKKFLKTKIKFYGDEVILKKILKWTLIKLVSY